MGGSGESSAHRKHAGLMMLILEDERKDSSDCFEREVDFFFKDRNSKTQI